MSKVSLTGWVDYDRPHLRLLIPMERIDYFEKRVRLTAVNPLKRILGTEIQPEPDSSALLIFGLSICCAIEALGKFLGGGDGGNSDRFYAFLYEYMDDGYESLKLDGNTYGEILWKQFRNGLAHGFVICNGGFEELNGASYFIVKNGMLTICQTVLYRDFVQGFERYVDELRKTKGSGPLFENFNKVFETVYILGQ